MRNEDLEWKEIDEISKESGFVEATQPIIVRGEKTGYV